MIPPTDESVIRQHLSARDVALLSLIVTMLQTIRDVRLERLAEALPLPILFESRRKNCNAF